MRITWKKAALAAMALAAATAPWTLAAAAEATAVKEAARAGLKLEVGETRVRPWRVELLDVRASGRKKDVEAKKVVVLVDASLEVLKVLVTGAKVTAELSEEPREGRASRRPPVEVLESEVAIKKGSLEIYAKARQASLSPEGLVSFQGDAEVKSGGSSAVAEKVTMKDVDPGKRVDASARTVKVKVGRAERKGGGAGTGGREIEGSLKAESISVEMGGRTARAESATVDVKVSRESTLVGLEARKAEAEGSAASQIVLRVRRDKGEAETAEVELLAESIETANEKLSNGEFSVEKVRLKAEVKRDGETLSLERANVKVGGAEVNLTALLSPAEFRADAEMPEVDCQSLLESLPNNMVPRIRGSAVEGTISWRASVQVDLPERKKPDVSIWLQNRCRVKEVPEELRVSRLRRPFAREVYSSKGKRVTDTTGPGGPDWVPLGMVSPYMPLAVMATEDPSFMSHRGILVQALENSMEQNISAGRFVRGGSTISMQLAKNLWLAREKTISRKIQEFFLTTYLEQRLTKTEEMELYLNVVEFGPDLYGIGPAAKRYFSKDPAALTLSQSLFLASLLPSPKSAGFEEGKKVGEGRLGFLRKIMKMMLDRGSITQAQYEQGVKERPVFGEPSAYEGEDVSGVRAAGGIDPSEWR